MSAPQIFIAAGEVSGDALGGDLMAAMRATNPEIKFSGIGGAAMQAQGLDSLFDIADISVFGIFPVLARLPNIVRRLYQTLHFVLEQQPNVVVLIDSPDFMHALARRIKRRAPHIKIICYVAPQVWAWRRGRARKMRPFCDAILALLPFEPQVFAAAGGPPCYFVGHSVATRAAQHEPLIDFRAHHNIATDTPLLCVLLGSRAAEIKRLAKPFAKTIAQLAVQIPNLQIAMPLVPHLSAAVREETKNWACSPIFIENEGEKWAAFTAADAALATSGTVSLELTLTQTPMAIAYDTGAITNYLALRLMQMPSGVLTNLILDKPLIKEFLGERATPELIAPEIHKLLTNKTANAQMREALAEVKAELLPEGGTPAGRAAEIVFSFVD